MIDKLYVEKGKLLAALEYEEDWAKTHRERMQKHESEASKIKRKITKLDDRIASLKKAGAE